MGKKLRIGFNRDFYPLAHGDSERCSGIVIDIVKKALARTEFSVEFVPRSLNNLSRQFADGEIHAFAGIAITDERRRQVKFSTPLIDSGGAWFRLSGRESPLETAATPKAGPLAAVISSLFPDVHVQGTSGYDSALGLALAGDVDAAALNIQVGRHIAQRDYPGIFSLPESPFYRLQLALAFARETDLRLINAFNCVVDVLHENGSIDAIVSGHMS